MAWARAGLKNVLGGYPMWILFVLMYVCAAAFLPELGSPVNFQNIIVQGTVVAILSLGMTFVMLVGEIDLSIVSIAGFAPLMGVLSFRLGVPLVAAFVLSMLVGAGVGLYNGLMMEKVGIPSLVQTVATWWILSGIILVITEGETKQCPPEWNWLGNAYIGPVRVLLIFFVLFVIIVWSFSKNTKTGLRLYLTGGNENSARAAGIPTTRIRILAFILSGVIGAVAGYTLSARLGAISSRFGTEWLMPAIAAPVISGVSLTGGRGNLINVVAGAFIVQLIVTIIRVAGIGGYYYELTQGLLVFVAILIDTLRRRMMGIKE